MSAAGPSQSANCSPPGGSEAAKLRAWGDHTSRIALRACAALFAAASIGVVTGTDTLTVDDLMRALRAPPERHASFEETRRMAVLTQPLVRRGSLDYERPDRLTMQVDTPYFEQLTIIGDSVTVERASGVTRLSLAAQPTLASWIESIRATLAGDRDAFAAHFDVSVEGSLASWRLMLVPRNEPLRSMIVRVSIAGHDGDPTRFEMDETRGDSTIIDIVPRPKR